MSQVFCCCVQDITFPSLHQSCSPSPRLHFLPLCKNEDKIFRIQELPTCAADVIWNHSRLVQGIRWRKKSIDFLPPQLKMTEITFYHLVHGGGVFISHSLWMCSCPISQHRVGRVYGLHCSQAPGGGRSRPLFYSPCSRLLSNLKKNKQVGHGIAVTSSSGAVQEH